MRAALSEPSMPIGERVRRALGWAAWVAALGLGAWLFTRVSHWDSPFSAVLDLIDWGPFLAALLLHLRRDARGAVVLGGFVIGCMVGELWLFFDPRGAIPFVLVLGLAVLGNRLHRLDDLSPHLRITLLSLGALSAVASLGLAYDANELRYGPMHVTPGISSQPTVEWATTVAGRAAIEALCLGAIGLAVHGRTAGLFATIAFVAIWSAWGATPSVREWCGCLGCPDHPLSRGGGAWVGALTTLALAPWLPAMLRRLAPPRATPCE